MAPARRGALALLTLASAVAAAPGDHHVLTSLRCSDCHVMHFDPTSAGALGPTGIWFGGGVAQPALLRNQVNDLCLSCHDGSPLATDVLGPNAGSQPGIVRSAGHLGRIGLQGIDTTGHTLDALDAAPGSVPSWRPEDENGAGRGLNCINCHDPHGAVGPNHPTGSQFRNLRSNPGNGQRRWVTQNSTPGLNDLTRDVFVRQANSYDETRLDWNEPSTFRSANARWCGGCHNNIHSNSFGDVSGPGAGGALSEHPVEDQNLEPGMLSRYNSHANRVKVMSSVGIWSPAGPDVTPTCVSCHRAHGNGNPDGLIFRSGTGTPTEDGDTNGTSQADLCGQCHTGTPDFSPTGFLEPGTRPTGPRRFRRPERPFGR